MNKAKLVYVGFAYLHHKGNHAGYHHLKEFVDYDFCIDCQKEFEMFYTRQTNPLKRLFRKAVSSLWGIQCPLAMIRCIFISWFCRSDMLFHVVYGENIFLKCFFRLKRKKHKVVYTVHQPFEWFEGNGRRMEILKKPDLIIILSESEKERFGNIAGHNKVVYIPHGIYTDFYTPGNEECRDNSVLMVGNWLRDFDFALEVFTSLKERKPGTRINVVGIKERKEFFGSMVNYFSGISDEELLDLYRKSAVLYLPLKRFTANNALLEAASVGCNIVIATENISDNSYIPENFVTFTQKSCEADVNILIDKIDTDEGTNCSLRNYVRKNYDWKVIGRQVLAAYNDLYRL